MVLSKSNLCNKSNICWLTYLLGVGREVGNFYLKIQFMIVSKLSIPWNPIWQYLIIHVILLLPCFNLLTLVKQTNKQTNNPTEWKFVGNYFRSRVFYIKKNNKKVKIACTTKMTEQIGVNCLPKQHTQTWQCKRK